MCGGACVLEGKRQEGYHGGQDELMAPAEVEDVIGEAQEDHAADGQQRRHELLELHHHPLSIITTINNRPKG